MISPLLRLAETIRRHAGGSWSRLAAIGSGAAALLWFLVRVIPKPSRAELSVPARGVSYRLRFCDLALRRPGHQVVDGPAGPRRRTLSDGGGLSWGVDDSWRWPAGPWFLHTNSGAAEVAAGRTDWNFIPAKPNRRWALRGVSIRAAWSGRATRRPRNGRGIGSRNRDQWWLDANTDQARVDAMLDATLVKLTGAANGERRVAGDLRVLQQELARHGASAGIRRARSWPSKSI